MNERSSTSAATVGSARVGTSPLWVAAAATGAAAPAKVQVRFAAAATARKAGFSSGLVFGVARSDASTAAGKVAVQFDPSLLAGESGGDLGQRLRLVELPACALTTPNLVACQKQTAVKTTVDSKTGRLEVTVPLVAGTTVPATQVAHAAADVAMSPTAGRSSAAAAQDVSSPMTVLAATSPPEGSAGTFAATSIKPSDQWSAGGSTGDFTYSYPITVPGTLGGSAPSVALSYASSSVDGETVDTNSQVSSVGDGWSDASSFIERSYQSCSQDGIAGSSDSCWADGGHQVSLSGGNLGGAMVWDDATRKWHLSGSDATIQLVTGGANGAYDGEYWEITTEDGTRMYYGAGKLPTAEGGTGSDVATNSVSTEPVYCPKTGDCDGATSGAATDFTANMPYRWYLDFVIDPHGNTTEYSYTQETNYYARGSAHTDTVYDRDAYLDSISYGWRASDIAAEGAKPAPAAKVSFTEAERCIVSSANQNASPPVPAVTSANCGTSLTSVTAPYWYDTPFDQVCASTGTCANDGPSYFSEMRLTGIATYVNTGSTTSYSPKEVDSYALKQSFPATGDGTSPELRLESIIRTGWDGSTSLPMPAVTFDYTQMANRVAGAAGWPAMMHYRIDAIADETGGVTDVFYSTPDCNQSASSPDLPTPSDDTRQCYQEYWTPPDSSMISDWFEKYVVTEVQQSDTFNDSPLQTTHYIYPADGAAWHRNDSPLVPNAQRTWDQWRGYASVITETGTAPTTETETTYLRGMDGDSTSATADTPGAPVTVTTTDGQSVTDSNQYAGYVLETQTFSQAGGSVVTDDISLPWSASTASHAETATGLPVGVPAEQAWFVEPQTTIDRGALSTGGWRTTQTVDTYSATTGMLTQTDSQGDTSLLGTHSSNETCSTVSYATPPGTGLNTGMTGLPGETTTVSVTSGSGVGTAACPAKTAANTVSDTRTFYDGSTTAGVIPAGGVGNVTETEAMGAWSGSTEGWTVTATSPSGSTGFDAYGRQLSSTNAHGDTETYSYTPTTGTLPTSTSTTNVTAGNWTTTTSVDQLRQLPTKLVDANGNTTVEAYDQFGRLTAVWLPGNTGTNASKKFTYSLGGQTTRTWTETQILRDDGTYSTEFEIYDGFMQLLQEQSLSLDSGDSNGSNVTDFAYDSHGWQIKTSSTPYYIPDAPSSDLYEAADANVPGQTVTTYDGLGRSITSSFYSDGHPQWSSSTAYPGVDRTDTTAPAGGTATTTMVDAQGRTTASLQYHTNTPTGTATETDYAYTIGTTSAGALDSISTITDASKHEWTQTTDAQGDQIAANDPDAGSSSATYDAEGDELTSTDGNGTVLSYTYDILGRKTAEYNGTTQDAATKLMSWSYDSAIAGKGLPASQSSYYGGYAYTESTTGYTDLGSPTQTTVTIPTSEGNLAGSYSVSDYYTQYTGTLDEQDYGTDGGLPAEDVDFGYTEGGTLDSVAGNTEYLTQVISDPLGQVTRATVGGMPDQLVQTNYYDADTDRITESILDTENNAKADLDDTSTYWNAAGQITAQNDAQDYGANTDLQCYTYDGQGRLTTAWTDTAGVSSAVSPSVPNIGGCKSASPSAATNGGPAPYWETYSYDPNSQSSGNRSTVTDYNTSGAVTSAQSYGYNTTTGTTGQPDTLQSLTTTNGSDTTLSNASYNYYPDGSTESRTVTNGSGTITGDQSYTYDPTGLTSSITDTINGNATNYEYDATGNLLLQKDTIAGSTTTTLYLPNEQLTMNSTGGITAQRDYDTGSGITVIRDNTGNLTYETGTSQGTGTLTISSALTNESRRSYTPYGTARGTVPGTWINGLGYLGQPTDPATTLDLLGAREYDPTTGRFLQRDSVLEATDPNQLGGYTYSGDDPVNGSDPDGLFMITGGGTGGDCVGSVQHCTGNGGGGSSTGSTGSGSTGSGGGGGGGGGGSGSGDTGSRSGTVTRGGGGTTTPVAVTRLLTSLIQLYSGPFGDYLLHGHSTNTVAFGVSTPIMLAAQAAYNGGPISIPPPVPATPKQAAPSKDTYSGWGCDRLGIASDCQGTPPPLKGGGVPSLLKGAALLVGGVLLTGADVLQAGADPGTDAATAADADAFFDLLDEGDSGAEDEASSCSSGNSFAPVTPVLMAGGKTEPISAIKVGDKVEAANPATGKLEGARTVVATMVHYDNNLINVTIRDSHDHTSTLHTTTEHEFWDDTLHTWVAASQLTPGHALETPTGGHAYVTSLHLTPGSAYRYNLTIQQLHTYYVLAGTTPILVHNSSPRTCGVNFPSSVKQAGVDENLVRNGANLRCEYCNQLIQLASRSMRGVTPPLNDLAYDHFLPVAAGGMGTLANLVIACRQCNGEKSDQDPQEWLESLLESPEP